MSMTRPSGIPSHDLVFYIDMALVGVVGAVTLIYLPRTFTRYLHQSTRRDGWILRRTRTDLAIPRSPQNKDIPLSTAHIMQYPPDRSASHLPSTPDLPGGTISERSSRLTPPHFRSYTSYIPAVGRILDYRILGLSVHQLVILAGYITVTAVALFYQSDPTTNVPRAGYVVISQMPIVFALGTKNSVVGLLTGISYEKLNFLHRWVGRIMFIAALFHFVGWLVLWTKLGVTRRAVQSNPWGLVAFFALCFSALASHPWVRSRLYTLFWNSHIIGLLAMMIGVWKHQPKVAVPYVATCIALYGADQLARLAKTRVRKAILTPLPELGSTHVHILGINSGWAAGQHVRIRVLSFGVGLFGWTEAHPFTISNSGNGPSDGMTLICKNAGDWTLGLYKMASGGSKDQHRTAYILVEGPYGGLGNKVFASFSGAMLVLGGSGITFGTSVLEDLVAKSLSGSSHLVCIHLVWVIQHPSASTSFLASFTDLAQRAAQVANLQLSISIFYTRGSEQPFVLPPNLPSNIQIQSGRPDIGKELEQLIGSTQAAVSSGSSMANGVVLAGCGPKSLISSVFRAKTGVSDESQKAIGGLELHT
ncbi:hypothetical protein FRC07_007688, partial [Ceratobasidium sp. 392]